MEQRPTTSPDSPPAEATADISQPYSETDSPIPVAGPTEAEKMPQFAPSNRGDELGKLGPYRVIRELGRGGMGAVYLGFDDRLKRKVALKVMLPKYAAMASAKSRFLREARAAAQLTHDHIVTIYEADERDGTPYMAMQYLQGVPLDQYLKQKPLIELHEVLRIGREIACGLAAAHEMGLVHRDIKPANLWVEAPTGRVKILDFGLAKPTQDETGDVELTATGVVLGTPSYMSPEQALGEKADHRADLFSLGVVLYRMTTGRAPFKGSTTIAMLASVLTDEPTPVRELNPGVPESFARLIHQLLAKKADDRPDSAQAVQEAIHAMERGSQTATIVPFQALPLDSLPTATRVPTGADPFAELEATEPEEFAHTVSSPSARRSPMPKWPFVAIGVLLVALAVVLPQVISISTPKGTLVIETNDDSVEVVVKKGGATIHDKTKMREITLTVGDDYTIDLAEQKDGLKLSTNRFEITRGGKAVVKVRVDKPAVVVKPKVESVVAKPFRELLGGTTEELRAWAKNLPLGFRPASLSVRNGANPVRFDAVALPLPGEWHLTVGPADTVFPEITKEVLERVTPMHWATARVNGIWQKATLWLPTTGGIRWDWYGAEDSTAAFYQRGNDDYFRPRPITLAGQMEEGEWCESILWVAGPWGSPWEVKASVPIASLAKLTEDARAKGWRPQLLATYSGVHPAQFRVLLTENTPNYEWSMTVAATEEEFQKELKDRGERGFFPKSLCSTVANGRVEYTALWLKEPATFQVNEAGRKALHAVLDSGAEIFLEAYDTRFTVRPGQRVPEGPFLFTGLNYLPPRTTDHSVVDKISELPPGAGVLGLNETTFGDTELAKIAAVRGLSAVKDLRITSLPITDAALESVGKFHQLENLEMRNSPITGKGFAHLSQLKNLRILLLDDCAGLKDDDIAPIGQLTSLTRIWSYSTNLSDKGIAHLGTLTNLEDLSLWGPRITDKSAATLGKLKKLKSMALGDVGLTDAGFAELKAMTSLKDLRLEWTTKLTGKGLASVKDFPSLETLRFWSLGAAITDETIAALSECDRLRFLELGNSQVTQAGVTKLAKALPKCRIQWSGGVVEPKP